MKIVFLTSARGDLEWFRLYYSAVFPAGAARAQRHYRRILTTLRAHPLIGRPTENESHRRLAIPRTPFVVVYRVAGRQIEILHIRDARSDHEAGDGPAES